MYRIIGSDGKEYGPITAEQLRQWISQARVNGATQGQLDGGEWKPLAQFPELNLTAPPVAAPPAFSGRPANSGAPARTSALAVTALVLGILGLPTCGITALVGLVLGIIALMGIRRSEGRLGGSGVAIAGIIVSAVFLMMIPVMAGLMVPAFAKARQRAMTITCQSNMRELSLAVRMYAGDSTNQFPPAASWSDGISSYVGSTRAFQCPGGHGQRCSYAFNRALDGKKLDEVNPTTVLLFESDAGWNGAGGAESMVSHGHVVRYGHEVSYNVLYVDGSVETVSQTQLAKLRWTP